MHGGNVPAYARGFQFEANACQSDQVKTWLKIIGSLVLTLGVAYLTFLLMGYSPQELKHLGEVRNMYTDNGRTVDLPFPEGSPARLLPEVPVTTDGEYAFITVDDGAPVRHDPCRPLRWVLATADMPHFAQAEVEAAVAEISARSGIQFEYLGTTDELPDFDRPLFQEERYGGDYAPLIIGWSDAARTPDLEGTVSGVGGATVLPGAYGTQRYLRSGVIVLDVDDLRGYFASSAGALQVRAIIMHELGHVLGLAHVSDSSQLMYELNHTQLTWGQGDLAGLAIAGQGPCES